VFCSLFPSPEEKLRPCCSVPLPRFFPSRFFRSRRFRKSANRLSVAAPVREDIRSSLIFLDFPILFSPMSPSAARIDTGFPPAIISFAASLYSSTRLRGFCDPAQTHGPPLPHGLPIRRLSPYPGRSTGVRPPAFTNVSHRLGPAVSTCLGVSSISLMRLPSPSAELPFFFLTPGRLPFWRTRHLARSFLSFFSPGNSPRHQTPPTVENPLHQLASSAFLTRREFLAPLSPRRYRRVSSISTE